MKQQTMFRGEAKKAKPTKMDKAYDHDQKMKRRAAASEAKKKEEQ